MIAVLSATSQLPAGSAASAGVPRSASMPNTREARFIYFRSAWTAYFHGLTAALLPMRPKLVEHCALRSRVRRWNRNEDVSHRHCRSQSGGLDLLAPGTRRLLAGA